MGAIYKKVAVRSIEKCLFLVRSMAGPPERICTSSLPTPMAAHRIGWRAVVGCVLPPAEPLAQVKARGVERWKWRGQPERQPPLAKSSLNLGVGHGGADVRAAEPVNLVRVEVARLPLAVGIVVHSEARLAHGHAMLAEDHDLPPDARAADVRRRHSPRLGRSRSRVDVRRHFPGRGAGHTVEELLSLRPELVADEAEVEQKHAQVVLERVRANGPRRTDHRACRPRAVKEPGSDLHERGDLGGVQRDERQPERHEAGPGEAWA